MKYTNTVIIGGGQAGLAMSRCLRDRAEDHVVLERGRVAERWRSERWDSLRLLTPNWMSRLPGWSYQGPDPEGYMTMPEVLTYFEGYARSSQVPLEVDTNVLSVESLSPGYLVRTDRGGWRSQNVVIATGYCDRPYVPAPAAHLAAWVDQLTPSQYRNPEQLADGGVLVVGASASGLQLAEEIHESGRPVTLAGGRHIRFPRRYRGRDILWWLNEMGILDETAAEVYDLEIARHQPSLQLVGRPDQASLDLPSLQRLGVRLTGRLIGATDSRVTFADDLVSHTVASDVKLAMLRHRIDRFIEEAGLAAEVPPPEPFVPFHWPEPAPAEIDLRSAGIKTVLWATGFRRAYPWLKVPVLDERGEILHTAGVTPAPGLYVIGLQFLRRRKSAFIDGVGDDAMFLADRICDPQGCRLHSVA